jgi:hypothetical protein
MSKYQAMSHEYLNLYRVKVYRQLELKELG